MKKPIKEIKRTSIGMGQDGLNYNKMEDFRNSGWVRTNPTLLHDYGRNIYKKGKRIGYAFDIRICGYRGLPVNSIRSLCFVVDGKEISDDCKYIWYEDREYHFDDIGTTKIENNWFWKYGDYIRVFIQCEDGIPQGIHDVEFGLALRDHYSSVAHCTKQVTIV